MKLNFKKFGEGKETLIILHGMFGSLDNWQSIAKFISEKGFTAYTIDQRNHGKSPHSEAHSYELMAADLAEFIKEHQTGSVHLLGHSMGGKTVMKFALQHSDEVKSLIVADMAPKAYPDGHDDILEALCSFPIDEIKSRKEADEVLGKKIKSFAIRQFLLKNIDRKSDGGYQWKMNLPAIKKHYEGILEEVNGEGVDSFNACFIRGGKSNYVQDEDIPDIERLFPNAEIVTIAEAGHWVHAEATENFTQKVLNFLNQNS